MAKKILFFGVSIILGIFIIFTTYQSSYIGAIQDRITAAMEAEDYDGLAKSFLMYFNKEEKRVIEDYKGQDQNGSETSYSIIAYEALVAEDITVTQDGQDQKVRHYAQSLVLFVDDIKFILDGKKDGETVNNYAAVRLYNDNEGLQKDFTFNDPIDATAQADANRYYIEAAKQMGFVELDITESYVKENLNGEITALQVIDGQGNTVGDKIDFDFDFTGAFYDDTEELVTLYDAYVNDPTEENKNAYVDYATTWQEDFLANENYDRGYLESELKTTSLYVKTAIVAVVYIAICVVLGYFFLRKKGKMPKPYKLAEMQKAQKAEAIKAEVKEVTPVENVAPVAQETTSVETTTPEAVETNNETESQVSNDSDESK